MKNGCHNEECSASTGICGNVEKKYHEENYFAC